MVRRFRSLIIGAALGASLSAAPLARAQDGGAPDAAPLLDAGADGSVSPGAILAYYCGGADLECTIAGPLEYAKTIQLPFAFDWDTNWIPNGSPLQVRFYVKMPAETTVELDGQLQTTWPQSMTLATPGGSRGFLGFDYGLEVGAKARIDANVAGIPIKWSGDIPYVPQIDFHMKGATLFTPWAFAPNGAKASAFTKSFTLFDVNLLGLAGVPSQISKGGVSLDVKGELSATYTTDRIQIDPAGTNELPVQSASGTAYRAFPGGAFVEYDVWPEGTVHYDGTLHLIPAFFIEVLGKKFSIPITDFPLSMPIGDQAFVFDPVRVHVPLPDIEELEGPDHRLRAGGDRRRQAPQAAPQQHRRSQGARHRLHRCRDANDLQADLALHADRLRAGRQRDDPLHAAEGGPVRDRDDPGHERPRLPLHQGQAARPRRGGERPRLSG